jgi:hypothetical protein
LREFVGQPVSGPPFFRSVRLRQAALPSSDSTSLLQGPFAPRALPRFLATTSLSATLWAVRGYLFPLPVGSRLPGGLPRFLSRSVLARRPQPPRRSRPVLAHFFPAHRRLHPVRRTGRSLLSNEAESGSLPLRLTSPPARGFDAPGFPSRRSPASCCTSNYMVNSFRPLDLPDLSWRTDREGAVPSRLCSTLRCA